MTEDQKIDLQLKTSLESKEWIQVAGKIVNVDKILTIQEKGRNAIGSIITLIDGTTITTGIPFSVFELYCRAHEVNLSAGLMTE